MLKEKQQLPFSHIDNAIKNWLISLQINLIVNIW